MLANVRHIPWKNRNLSEAVGIRDLLGAREGREPGTLKGSEMPHVCFKLSGRSLRETFPQSRNARSSSHPPLPCKDAAEKHSENPSRHK